MVRKIIVIVFSLLIMPFNGYGALLEMNAWKKNERFTSEGFLKKPNRISPFCSSPQNSIIEESEEDEAFEQAETPKNPKTVFTPSSFLIPGFSEAPEQKKNFKEQLAGIAKSLLPDIKEERTRFYLTALNSSSESDSSDSEKEHSKSENNSPFFKLTEKPQSRFFQSSSDSSDSECSESNFEATVQEPYFEQVISDYELKIGKFNSCFTKEQLEALQAVAAMNDGIATIKININDIKTREKINQAVHTWQPPLQKNSVERVRSSSF